MWRVESTLDSTLHIQSFLLHLCLHQFESMHSQKITLTTSGEVPNAGLTFELRTPVEDERPIILVGSFCNWEVDPAYTLTRSGEGLYQYVFPLDQLPDFPLEYKYVKGSWAHEETDVYGSPIQNRSLEQLQSKIQDYVPRWQYNDKAYREDYLPKPVIISEAFEIPQLFKTRRISVLLPHDYHETDRRYPVLYLQDGQNLFDPHAPFGTWGVDKRMAVLTEKGKGDLIVVAIDHAEEDRIAEYTPSYPTRLGPGDGKKYVRFLADTLKPYIDQHFRTRPERQHTGIGGSSMGGLISVYAGLMYPEVYGRMLIFSPSLWVAPNIHFHQIQFQAPVNARIYIYGGEKESQNMVPNLRRFKAALEQSDAQGSQIDFHLSIDPEGVHNEWHWGREFPKAVEWLFFQSDHE
jgi:predicted alpha/beta superfamily hydrolase